MVRQPFAKAIFLCALLVAVIVPEPHAGAQSLAGAGATYPFPVYKRWFDSFRQDTGIRIDYQAVGSGAGITAFKRREVDFAATDIPLSSKEEAAMPFPVIQIPTLGVAIVLIYNIPGIPSGLHLSGDVIADIYLGKLTRWNDARIQQENPGLSLPDLPIYPVHLSDGSGVTAIFTSYLSAVSMEWKEKIGAGKSVVWRGGRGAKG